MHVENYCQDKNCISVQIILCSSCDVVEHGRIKRALSLTPTIVECSKLSLI